MNVKSDDAIRAWLITEMRKMGTLAATLEITMQARDAFSDGVARWDNAHDASLVDATMIADSNGDTITANEQRAVIAAQRFYDSVRGQQRSAPYPRG